jgi:pimeloyl-ACP methyl ester carboxylesterase
MKFWLLMGALIVLVALAVALALLWTPDKSRTTLEAKYLNAPSDYLDVAGMRLHVRDSGPKAAPVLILLHGFGSSLHTWEPWAQALSTRYRVIRYDLPGSGLTGADPTGDYTDTRGLVVLKALMDKLAIARATLIGNSLGGRLAWTFAATDPSRIDKLVLISPDGFASHGMEYGKAADVPAMLHLMKYVLPKSMLRSGLAPAYGDPSRLSDPVVDRYFDLMLAPGVRAAQIAKMGQIVLVPPEPLLARITAPTLLLWGDKDGMIPISNAADYLKAMPQARLATLPGLGHVPFEEAPDVSLVPVEAFLGQPQP